MKNALYFLQQTRLLSRRRRAIGYAIELRRFAAYAAFAAPSKMLRHF